MYCFYKEDANTTEIKKSVIHCTCSQIETDEYWTAVVNGFEHCINITRIYWDLIRSRAMHKLEAANLC